MRARLSLGVCPQNYRQYCCQCRIWRWEIDLRPIRAELREMGLDPDEGVLEKSIPGEC